MTENQIKRLFILSRESQSKNNDMENGLQEIANEFRLLKSKMDHQEQKLREEQKFREEQKLEIQDLKNQIQLMKELHSQGMVPIHGEHNEADTEKINQASFDLFPEEPTKELTSNRKRSRTYNPKWMHGSVPKQNRVCISKRSKNIQSDFFRFPF